MPLGAPLMDTIVEVRDDQGGVVTEGEGQVFIGDVVMLTHTDADLSSTCTLRSSVQVEKRECASWTRRRRLVPGQ